MCFPFKAHQVEGNKKATNRNRVVANPTEIFCSGRNTAPHIDQKQRAFDQGTLASPSQVAAPSRALLMYGDNLPALGQALKREECHKTNPSWPSGVSMIQSRVPLGVRS